VIELSRAETVKYIERLARALTVFSEVGRKEHGGERRRTGAWVKDITEELGAGRGRLHRRRRRYGTVALPGHGRGEGPATRRSRPRSIRPAGHVRGTPEAQQSFFFLAREALSDSEVNLGNRAAARRISVETIRQGLRADPSLDA